MDKFILLFRGINVGGKNLMPMKALIPMLEQHGYQEVSSYIQSGNVVLKSDLVSTDKIKNIITKNFGFTPEVLVLNQAEFLQAQDNNQYKNKEGKFVHFYFCKQTIEVNKTKLLQYIADTEQYEVIGNVFYLHAPNGIGRSKLVANIQACLGQSATGRNLNTVNKISNML